MVLAMEKNPVSACMMDREVRYDAPTRTYGGWRGKHEAAARRARRAALGGRPGRTRRADPGRTEQPGAEERAATLLAAWREAGRPVVHVRHLSEEPNSPLRPSQPGVEIKEIVRPAPGESVVETSVNSAFIGTGLEERLRADGIETLVIAGLTTDHCVCTTARMAGNPGFETYVVFDATFERSGRGDSFPASRCTRSHWRASTGVRQTTLVTGICR
jgi:nicotinamidase-related amidase